jgi:SAM-dependent methyltransferase
VNEPNATETEADALARLYDLDLAEDPGDLELYRALARRTGDPILELGVGSGRVARALTADGHRVVGVDNDPGMLARARTRSGGASGGSLSLVEGDLVDAPEIEAVVSGGPYALAFVALNSILLLASAERQRGAFHAMARLLGPGGLAVVDAWQPSPHDLVAFDGRLSLEWLRTDPSTGRAVTKTVAAWFDPATRLVTLTTIFEEGLAGEPARRWTRSDALRLVTVDELASYALTAGLEVEQLAGDHDLGPLEPDSERVVLIARKP